MAHWFNPGDRAVHNMFGTCTIIERSTDFTVIAEFDRPEGQEVPIGLVRIHIATLELVTPIEELASVGIKIT